VRYLEVGVVHRDRPTAAAETACRIGQDHHAAFGEFVCLVGEVRFVAAETVCQQYGGRRFGAVGRLRDEQCGVDRTTIVGTEGFRHVQQFLAGVCCEVTGGT